MDDRLISDLLQKRKDEALEYIAEKYGGLIRKLIANILSDPQDIEEAVNDTYMNIWMSSDGCTPLFFSAFVCRIAKNTALKKARYNSACGRTAAGFSPIDELAEILSGNETTESEADEKLLTAAINNFLEKLPPKKRTVFVKRYWYCETLEDIAKETGIKKGTVSAMLLRMRNALKENLKKEGWFHE
ncbi:MAG: sigma-70 family RNA polymerase sigma factor [Clostridia bacterium]|nr:sigma-70 family RNA polymerase sigma factor [Clostridia bacterium]